MAILKSKWKDMSFYTGFNYMRLIDSGSVTGAANSTHTIPLPAGTYTPFAEGYMLTGTGDIIPIAGQFSTGVNFRIQSGNLVIKLGPSATVYYFLYRSNAG